MKWFCSSDPKNRAPLCHNWILSDNLRGWLDPHVWQGRFYSCPLDDSHLWTALRYVELNPVRAGMVSTAEEWQWSSAAAHCDAAADRLLEMETWQKRCTVAEWREYVAAGESQNDVRGLRQCTHTGRPLGSAEFVARLEQATSRSLAPRKGGRPKKPTPDSQDGLAFVA
jgi:putative transposase